PGLENQPQLNTKESNTKELNTKYIYTPAQKLPFLKGDCNGSAKAAANKGLSGRHIFSADKRIKALNSGRLSSAFPLSHNAERLKPYSYFIGSSAMLTAH
ncbi:MAG: hypothetical protein LUI05_00560, partial [Oscillospiraceae bacterium]|nr:hypothetical protein [Oscillospiraceae bacterium]